MIVRLTDCDWMPMMGFGLLGMVLFWAVLVVAALLLARWGAKKRGSGVIIEKPSRNDYRGRDGHC